MASLLDGLPPVVRLIDAGAGAGALTHAFVRRACLPGSGVRSIDVTAYEVDGLILPTLEKTLIECEALCRENEIAFTAAVRHADFIQDMAGSVCGDLFSQAPPTFNVAIANPPYKKISTNSPERLALRSIGLETSNLYTGFVGLLARLLAAGGQLVAITPRSFCNGPYFQPFREYFLERMALQRLHLFDARDAAFRGDGVLQENIIFHATKGEEQPSDVTVSSSSGEAGAIVTAKRFLFTEVIYPNDPERFIHIPADSGHASARDRLSALPSTLATLGLTVSTGRVVDFRLKDALRSSPEQGTVPLLYPCHFNGGTVHWPKLDARKPNAILDNEVTRPWLVPSGIYLLTKRFTSKEERRRVVACLFDPSDVEAEWLGFENHLNYFHANGQGLDRHLALGLFVYLNSTLVDHYFRCFSGHTQVNATDLRKLAYPDHATLVAMGRDLRRPHVTQEELDQLVDQYLHGI
jgi:adenine-specific DNA-methyltransferase